MEKRRRCCTAYGFYIIMNSEEPIENEKIRFNKLKKFIWISYGKYVIICLLIEKTKKKGEKYDYYDNTFY